MQAKQLGNLTVLGDDSEAAVYSVGYPEAHFRREEDKSAFAQAVEWAEKHSASKELLAKHPCDPCNAKKFREWLATRGGLALWMSCDFGDSQSWTTPLLDTEGNLTNRPHWKCGGLNARPYRVITDVAEVEVVVARLVQRLNVKLTTQDTHAVLTKTSQRKLEEALRNAGPGSFYEPGGLMFPEMLIFAPDKVIPLADFDQDAWEKETAEEKERQ